jgi:hypothetical protein
MENKHTPGPWRWELNKQGKAVNLVGGKPTFDKTVMDFVRYGMGQAAPRFNKARIKSKENDGDNWNIMERCEVFSEVVPGREHHENWFRCINHPDAKLIAAAPELLESLIRLVDRLHELGHAHFSAVVRAEAAIKKATE